MSSDLFSNKITASTVKIRNTLLERQQQNQLDLFDLENDIKRLEQRIISIPANKIKTILFPSNKLPSTTTPQITPPRQNPEVEFYQQRSFSRKKIPKLQIFVLICVIAVVLFLLFFLFSIR